MSLTPPKSDEIRWFVDQVLIPGLAAALGPCGHADVTVLKGTRGFPQWILVEEPSGESIALEIWQEERQEPETRAELAARIQEELEDWLPTTEIAWGRRIRWASALASHEWPRM